jgi:GWxTD domain-containing protein
MITFVHSALGNTVGWTLFHSLWEGGIVALFLAVALSVLRSSRARYAIACLAMLAVLASFCYTFAYLLPQGHDSLTKIASPAPYGESGRLQYPPRLPAKFHAAELLPWLTPFWIAGVILFHLHTLASWLAARRLRHRGVCYAADPWQQRLTQLRDRVRLSTPVALLESSLARVPFVVGYLRPVILVPVGLLACMPALQIEAILLHELAHVRRRDYLVNLMQTVVEGFLFYHPAVWWISGVIRTERENCCDDLVVAVSGDAREYAAALATLEQNRWAADSAVLASTGGNLMKRIRRLLYPLEAPRTVLSPVLSAIILTITAALVLTAWQDKPQDNPAPTPYQKWLTEDVVYIITPQERTDFTLLSTDKEREDFIEQFWLRRDPTPGTVENEFKEEHYRRIGYANNHFEGKNIAGWKSDRGRIYIIYGPPDEIESHPKGGTYKRPPAEGGGEVQTYPFEQWRYHLIKDVGTNVIIEFVDPTRSGEYHMTSESNKDEKVIPPGEVRDPPLLPR